MPTEELQAIKLQSLELPASVLWMQDCFAIPTPH
jgi:hypothetical protein